MHAPGVSAEMVNESSPPVSGMTKSMSSGLQPSALLYLKAIHCSGTSVAEACAHSGIVQASVPPSEQSVVVYMVSEMPLQVVRGPRANAASSRRTLLPEEKALTWVARKAMKVAVEVIFMATVLAEKGMSGHVGT